ncbi:hypothetical protein [Thermoflavimicrobium daqui]|uniref:Uncharacterized protein n=1 Tax=Thermoflavimicrobium daqui TaxID=2137476 RepID=A0A364K496_9BACL|nr:hypothetical protein [Thermoflavimicrobium daqui]RAL24190.1 hypothetical protein DL897_10940 [Thermoflavimicrobium daqui]
MDYHLRNSKKRPVIFSAANVIHAKLPKDIEKTCSELNQITKGWIARYLCTFYLEWAYLVDQEIKEAIQFKNLYHPIIQLYERGGRISLHHHELICGRYGFPRTLRFVSTDRSEVDLSDEALDEYDHAWYYQKIIDELNNIENKEEMANQIMDRLQECSKFSRDIVFKIELARLMLDRGINTSELQIIKNELNQFERDDFGKQLLYNEKNHISMQIREMLNRLNNMEIIVYEDEGKKFIFKGNKLIIKS